MAKEVKPADLKRDANGSLIVNGEAEWKAYMKGRNTGELKPRKVKVKDED
jgi:hypothetical protein